MEPAKCDSTLKQKSQKISLYSPLKMERVDRRSKITGFQQVALPELRRTMPEFPKGTLGYALENSSKNSRENKSEIVEILSRSWSNSSMEIFQILCQSLELPASKETKEDGKMARKQDAGKRKQDLLVFNHMSSSMQWLKEGSLWRTKEARLHCRIQKAQVHVAVSAAIVAAAIASFTVKQAMERANGRKNMALASASALVAARCVEIAEFLGARHEQLCSLVSSAVAASSPVDILHMATKLQTWTALKGMRAACPPNPKKIDGSDLTLNCQALAMGRDLPTCTENGKTKLKRVYIYMKQSHVFLRLRNKHWGGIFTTSTYHTIVEMMENHGEGWEGRCCFTNEVNGFSFIGIRTSHDHKYFFTFKEEKECNVWASTISNLLQLSTTKPN
ncbi:VAN3-binding protein [Amborella trichopoda]|nr:VAN3-binding protein [Amborella trichopoda]|eukprot:XP_020526225.1 VAN3-binding protein [Amborella trichopoda]